MLTSADHIGAPPMKPLAAALTLSLAACANTIRGAGKDIGQAADATGDAIEDIVE